MNNILNEEQQKALQEFLSSLNYISCYIVGSTTAPFIKNKRDIDIAVISTEKYSGESLIEARRNLRYNYHIDAHVHDVDFLESYIYGDNSFLQYYCGKDLTNTIKLPLSNIEQTKAFLVRQCQKRSIVKEKVPEIKKYKIKIGYHIYAMVCYIKNNSYELTEEQIENINILHDMKEEDFEKRKELIDQIIKEVETWQI